MGLLSRSREMVQLGTFYAYNIYFSGYILAMFITDNLPLWHVIFLFSLVQKNIRTNIRHREHKGQVSKKSLMIITIFELNLKFSCFFIILNIYVWYVLDLITWFRSSMKNLKYLRPFPFHVKKLLISSWKFTVIRK